MNWHSLVVGFIFGIFGLFFLRQGKRQAQFSVVLVGITLLLYPYFIENPFLLWILGIFLSILGYRLLG
jgi:hypothetical protein